MYKAIAINTGEILATGTYPECHRLINARHRSEPAKIIPLHQPYAPEDETTKIERLAKEWELATIRDKEREKAEREKAEREARAEAERERKRLAGEKINLRWTPEMDAKLCKLYDTHTVIEIAEEIGRTPYAIAGRIIRLQKAGKLKLKNKKTEVANEL